MYLYSQKQTMSAFIVSARKYRPQRFEEVVGQQHVAGTLKNALATDHVAHAFLFTGPRGVGKTTCARILAKILNCEQRTPDHEACDQCASCRAFNENASFNIIELDAASNNSVEHIRVLIEQVRFQPQQGRYKVFIIDEVHMLSNQAFNAFLKTLEEPPPYAIFILATTEKHKIIPTILSRCQIFDFRRITIGDMVLHLKSICHKEALDADDEALHIIAQKADGALRDALSIFDRISASAAGGRITYEGVIENLNVLDYDYYFSMTDALLAEDLPAVMNLFDQILRKGFDPDIFVLGLGEHLRNILVCKDAATLQLLETGDTLRERYRKQAALAPASFLVNALHLANECDVQFKMARQKRLHVEMALVKMCYLGRMVQAAQNGAAAAIPEKKTPDGTFAAFVHKPLTPAVPPPLTGMSNGNGISIAAPAPLMSERSTGGNAQILSEQQMRELASGLRQGLKRAEAISLRLDDYDTAVVEEEAAVAGRVSRLSLENIQNEWAAYTRSVESVLVQQAFSSAVLVLQDKQLVVKVRSVIDRNHLQTESARLLPLLRDRLHDQALTLLIALEEKSREDTPQPVVQRPKTAKEKLENMKKINPCVIDLIQRMDLKLEE
jgi:DNA polymerase-3 subunit gamma/tau